MRPCWTSWPLMALPGPLRWFRRSGAAKLPLWHQWLPSQKDGRDSSTPTATSIFFDGSLNADTYRKWLDANAISYVALSNGPYDWAATDEASLVRRGLPYWRPVWSDRTWTLYAVTNLQPVISVTRTSYRSRSRFANRVPARAG